jgi:hypothetical protein
MDIVLYLRSKERGIRPMLGNNTYNPEVDEFDYEQLHKLRKEIDKLMNIVWSEEEDELALADQQDAVRRKIKAISFDLGIHRDFLAENR